MLEDFYLYVRGATEIIPDGYSEQGMQAYRHLVFLGASQMIEANYPALREQMGEQAWNELIKAFVRQSTWTSNYYGDIKDEFLAFLARESDASTT